jgi:hypothetical protein
MTGPASNQPDTFSAALRAGRIRVSSAAMASIFSGGDAQANGSGRHPPPRWPDACPAADGSVKRPPLQGNGSGAGD